MLLYEFEWARRCAAVLVGSSESKWAIWSGVIPLLRSHGSQGPWGDRSFQYRLLQVVSGQAENFLVYIFFYTCFQNMPSNNTKQSRYFLYWFQPAYQEGLGRLTAVPKISDAICKQENRQWNHNMSFVTPHAPFLFNDMGLINIKVFLH